MKFVFAGLLSLAASVSAAGGYACQQYLKDTGLFYYLERISHVPEKPHLIENVSLNLNGSPLKGKVYFNICEKVARPEACKDLEDKDSTGYFITEDQKCYALTSSKETNWKISSLEGAKTPDGIQFYANNDNLRAGYPWDIAYRLKCNREAAEPKISSTSETSVLNITFESSTACGKDLLGPFPTLLKNPYIIYPVTFCLGLALAGLGIIIYKHLFALIAFISGFGISFIFLGLLWNYDNSSEQSTKLYIMLGFSTFLGGLFAYLIWTMKRFAVFLVSMGLGVVIALQVYIFLAFYVEGARKNFVLLVLCAVFGIMFGLISDCSERVSVILSSSFGGTYLLVKGVGTLIGNYPDEITIAERIAFNQFDQVPNVYYVYLGVILVVGIICCIVQFRLPYTPDQPKLATEVIEDDSINDVYRSMNQEDISVDIEVLPKKK